MEYHLCKDNGNMLRCDFDCRKCANLVYDALTDENKRLRAELKKIGEIRAQECNEYIEKCAKLDKEREKLREKCAKLEKENDSLDQECESLLARFSERIAELEKENNDLRVTNDKLRTMNSELLYRNGLLMKTIAPNIFQKVYIYDELNDKIESLKEDIIRLDKCLSNRQCVKEERYGE